jgi:hypothetical protein
MRRRFFFSQFSAIKKVKGGQGVIGKSENHLGTFSKAAFDSGNTA